MNTHTNNDGYDSNRCTVFIVYDQSDGVRKEAEECYDLHENQQQQHSPVRDDNLFNHQGENDQERDDNETIVNAYLDDLCADITDPYDAFYDSSLCTVNEHDTNAAIPVHKKEDTKVVKKDLSHSRSSSSSSIDVTRYVLNNSKGVNFFNVKRVLPSAFDEHELSPKKQAISAIKENEHELPPNDYSERITASLESTLFAFQKVCSINQKQGQKIKWPAITNFLKRSADTDEGDIETGISWITFKRSLKMRFDRLSNRASVKFIKRAPPQVVASLLKKEKYETGALVIYGQTGSHPMILKKKGNTSVMCFVNAGILHCNFLRSGSCCETDLLGLEYFDFQHTPIVFPIVLKESSLFSKIYAIKLVNVIRFNNRS